MAETDKQGLPKLKRAGSGSTADPFLEETNIVASATECTGLMPTPPISDEEAESYTDIYPVPQTLDRVDNGLQKEKGIGGDMPKEK